MTISWAALIFCAIMGVFQLALALVNTARDEQGLAAMNTVLAIVVFAAGALNIPFITGAWAS